jgi:hypothetical protein
LPAAGRHLERLAARLGAAVSTGRSWFEPRPPERKLIDE